MTEYLKKAKEEDFVWARGFRGLKPVVTGHMCGGAGCVGGSAWQRREGPFIYAGSRESKRKGLATRYPLCGTER